jgi:hypothetical protein
MQLNLQSPLLALEPGQVLTLDDARGKCVGARYGSVWVTEEGHVEDHVVSPGGAYTIRHDGRTLVQALQPAWVTIKETPCN